MATTIEYAPGFAPSTYTVDTVGTRILNADGYQLVRDILQKVNPNDDDYKFISFLETGSNRIVKALTFNHFEKGRLLRAVTPGAVVGTATAASVTFTLTSNSYTASGQGDQTVLKLRDIVHLYGDIFGFVSAVGNQSGNAKQFTVTRRSGTSEDVGAAVTYMAANALPMAIMSNGNRGGSGMTMQTLSTNYTRYSGQFQTIKSYSAIDGDADAAMMEFTDSAGSRYKLPQLLDDQMKVHRAHQNFALKYSPDGAFSEVEAGDIPLTASVRSKLKSIGNKLYYDGTTGFTLADLDKLTNGIKLKTGSKVVDVFLGPDIRSDWENLIRAFTVNGGITAAGTQQGFNGIRFNDNVQNKGVDADLEWFQYKGIKYVLHEERIHDQVNGLSWQPFRREAYIMPAGLMNVSNVSTLVGVSKIVIPALTLCYKVQSGGQDRRFMELKRDPNTTFNDVWERGLQTQEGLQFVGAREGWYIAPGA